MRVIIQFGFENKNSSSFVLIWRLSDCIFNFDLHCLLPDADLEKECL